MEIKKPINPEEFQDLINTWMHQHIKNLYLFGNGLVSLPEEIANLTNLEELNLGGNSLSHLPNSIGNLINLRKLDLGYDPVPLGQEGDLFPEPLRNKIKNLPPQISKLKNLEYLNLGWNELEEIPKEIGNLSKLRLLYLERNKITKIPNEIRNLTNLKYLDLRGNNLPIPPEILQKVNEPKIILDYYFSIFNNQRKQIRETKLLILGQGSVGKSSLVKQILHGSFHENETKTEGISIYQWLIGNQDEEIKLNIWDFGGQEIMHATHQFFLTKRSLYLLVLDSRLTQEENRVEYWLKIIQSFGGESPILIVGNKIDQHPLDIDKTGLQKKYPNIVGILETSAATGQGIQELKNDISRQVNILPHVRDLLPETWFTVKSKLEELAKNKNFFTQDEFLDLCNSSEITDEVSQHTLIGFLHDLGVVLHFQDDPRLANLGILNPQWVTNGVYKILNSHELFQNKGQLNIELLNRILDLPEYPSNKRLFIVDMMKKFELCYDIEPDKLFLIPDLLQKDQPELNFLGIPAFEYFYPVLPSSVITRFIVRMNQKIYNDFVWRTGVVLKIGENTALVKADIEDRKISISIAGLEHTRRDALSAIRYQLDEIHESIKGLNPQKRVPIPEAPRAEPLDYAYLLQLERDGFNELPVKDGNRLVKVNVRKLLSGVVSKSERKKSIDSITNIYVGGDLIGGNIVSGNENQASATNRLAGKGTTLPPSPLPPKSKKKKR